MRTVEWPKAETRGARALPVQDADRFNLLNVRYGHKPDNNDASCVTAYGAKAEGHNHRLDGTP